ncbi:hypothetical protein ACIBG5_16840 [Kribbella sp. NPDC050241]|uniref:hypothetical protein n=1 Tax=Kribbella sp. NPDC050241 TaxID=3364115 RepID=UPI0037BAB75E
MRSIGRMVAMGAAAVAVVAGGATVAQAQTQTIHTLTCASQDECIQKQNVYRHYGYAVSDVWYQDPNTTCAPEWPCALGWQFQWEE